MLKMTAPWPSLSQKLLQRTRIPQMLRWIPLRSLQDSLYAVDSDIPRVQPKVLDTDRNKTGEIQ